MSVLTIREQQLYDAALRSLPEWFSDAEINPQETVGAFAKNFGKVWDQIDTWVDIVYLKRAFGIWLDQHARDRGTRRQAGELDGPLAARLVVPPDALTLPALTQIANAILAAAGFATATLVEGRKSGAYYHADGDVRQAFFGRGQRWDNHPHDLFVILPVGTDAGTFNAVAEAMRLFAAGGVDVTVEQGSPTAAYQFITITPPAATAVHGGGTVTFTAQKHVTDTVTWQVNGVVGGNATVGTIAAGVYTPPAAIPNPEDVEVQAVGALDGSVGRARVKIT